jgi:hypothetical protein
LRDIEECEKEAEDAGEGIEKIPLREKVETDILVNQDMVDQDIDG